MVLLCFGFWMVLRTEMGKIGKGWVLLGEEAASYWKLRFSLLATKTGAEQARVCQCLSWEIWTCLTPSTAWEKSLVKDKHSMSYERLPLNKSFYHNMKCIIYLNSRKYYKWVDSKPQILTFMICEQPGLAPSLENSGNV